MPLPLLFNSFLFVCTKQAPEVLRNETTSTTASDVYAFGILIYEAYSRKDPYEGEDVEEVLQLIMDPQVNKRPPVPKDCPPQMASIMCDCIVPDPNQRPSFEELDNRLKRVGGGMMTTSKLNPLQHDPKHQHGMKQVSLFDIFPQHIAKALQNGQKVEPEHHDIVTIFFSDIVDYTQLSSTLDPRKVANLLDRLYLAFDELSDKYQIFKVETIGDSYMAVTNLVQDQSHDHAKRMADFALDAIHAANTTMIDIDDPSKGYVHIRVGFHSGPVVADVVGSRNPRYCLFGDTVNTASRMESNSETNRILCSERTAKILQQQHCSHATTHRGRIPIKGKGEMATYWVGFSKDGDDEVGIEQPRTGSGMGAAIHPSRNAAIKTTDAVSSAKGHDNWKRTTILGTTETNAFSS